MTKKLYVGNLPFSASEGAVSDLFGQFGTVESVNLISDRRTGRPKGFGFVEMSSDDEAQKAIDGLNGTEFESRTLRVNEAKPRESGGGGGFRGRRGGGGGGGRY